MLLVGSVVAFGVTSVLVYPIAEPFVSQYFGREIRIVRAEVNNVLSILGLQRKATGNAVAAKYTGMSFQKL